MPRISKNDTLFLIYLLIGFMVILLQGAIDQMGLVLGVLVVLGACSLVTVTFLFLARIASLPKD